MLTRDGVRLDADLYYPDAAGPFPVLLMRQPYGRAIASTVVYAPPTWYAAHGYLVVIQDVRGRGTSEGEFKLFAHEINDGYDTILWAANLPGSTGEVGMYGFSYQGMTQLYAAAPQPAPLKTICPAMVGYDLYTDWAYEGGAFCLQANLGWAIQLAIETARLKGDGAAHQALSAAAKTLTFSDPIPARSSLLETLAPDSYYPEWLDHSEPGEYWERLSPKTCLQNVDLPMLHMGGWFDTYLRGTLNLYKAMAARSTYRQQLLIGPWPHLPWGRKVGAVDFGAEATSPCDRLQIRWFDHFLKGIDTGLLNEPPILLFEMGSNQWRSFHSWSSHPPTPFFLSSSGLASIDDCDGTLLPTPYSPPPTPDTLIHDPWRPVPALGGHAAFPAGAYDRASLDCRSDILTYTSAPLSKALYLAGEVFASIHCGADTPSFDLCAVLSEVDANGGVYPFSQGYRRINPGQSASPVQITLQSVCICLRPGNALRLSLSAACFPAYPVNDGRGTPPGNTRLIDQQIITVTVYSGDDRPSHLLLPVSSFSQP
ncbi:CocE/NonD family hydrolase [Kovacikia minuta CCNUW1]|uniref:CocE/NonD family hydrolase n=1 Tax=Kovacikia minuta TaxID=2931930 RepID=UPI001CCB62A0|nr:CocE/NonD family hydrolase [Kovacikia minuta CCNUW1]